MLSIWFYLCHEVCLQLGVGIGIGGRKRSTWRLHDFTTSTFYAANLRVDPSFFPNHPPHQRIYFATIHRIAEDILGCFQYVRRYAVDVHFAHPIFHLKNNVTRSFNSDKVCDKVYACASRSFDLHVLLTPAPKVPPLYSRIYALTHSRTSFTALRAWRAPSNP